MVRYCRYIQRHDFYQDQTVWTSGAEGCPTLRQKVSISSCFWLPSNRFSIMAIGYLTEQMARRAVPLMTPQLKLAQGSQVSISAVPLALLVVASL